MKFLRLHGKGRANIQTGRGPALIPVSSGAAGPDPKWATAFPPLRPLKECSGRTAQGWKEMQPLHPELLSKGLAQAKPTGKHLHTSEWEHMGTNVHMLSPVFGRMVLMISDLWAWVSLCLAQSHPRCMLVFLFACFAFGLCKSLLKGDCLLRVAISVILLS